MAKYTLTVETSTEESFSLTMPPLATARTQYFSKINIKAPRLTLVQEYIEMGISPEAEIEIDAPDMSATGTTTEVGTTDNFGLQDNVLYSFYPDSSILEEVSTSLTMGYTAGESRGIYFLFDSVTVPSESEIQSATLTLTCSLAGSTGSSFGVYFYGDKSTIDVVIPTGFSDFYGRPLTTGKTSLSYSDIYSKGLGDTVIVDITAQIQELVNMSHFTSGDDIGIICYSTGTSSSTSTWAQYGNITYDEPDLEITYL